MSLASPSPALRDLTAAQRQWIAGGYATAFATLPGQTLFIGLFGAQIRGEFGLSDGQYGLLYTIGTLASAVCLVWAGALADKVSIRRLTIACLLALAGVSISMAFVQGALFLGFAFFGLRFFGQGMLNHIQQTAMSRWFNRYRGRALAIAQLGYSTGEAILPLAVTAAIAAIGWRNVWLLAAAVLVLFAAPAISVLFANPPDGARARATGATNPDGMGDKPLTGAHWTRGKVLRDPLFYAAMLGVLAMPAIWTAIVFHQAHLVAVKGWNLYAFTGSFPVITVTGVTTSMIAGSIVDRFGAWRLLPFFLLPIGCACLLMWLGTSEWTVPALFLLAGLSGGTMPAVMSALWAELYGLARLGTIRALVTAGAVFASAAGPGIAGLLIDNGLSLADQGPLYAGYCFAAALFYLVLRPRFAARVESAASV